MKKRQRQIENSITEATLFPYGLLGWAGQQSPFITGRVVYFGLFEPIVFFSFEHPTIILFIPQRSFNRKIKKVCWIWGVFYLFFFTIIWIYIFMLMRSLILIVVSVSSWCTRVWLHYNWCMKRDNWDCRYTLPSLLFLVLPEWQTWQIVFLWLH